MTWISVKDRLPEHLDKVLVTFEGSNNILMASFHVQRGPEFLPFFTDGRQPTALKVSYWMPLPDAPGSEPDCSPVSSGIPCDFDINNPDKVQPLQDIHSETKD